MRATEPADIDPVSAAHRPWGKHVMIDMHHCQVDALSDPDAIRAFVEQLIPAIGMVAHGPLHLERFGHGDLQGWSAMQFIETSSVTIHADEPGQRCFVDVFSCMDFSCATVVELAIKHFGGTANAREFDR